MGMADRSPPLLELACFRILKGIAQKGWATNEDACEGEFVGGRGWEKY